MAVVGRGGGARRETEGNGTFPMSKERRGGGRGHADEEKCPTVLDQAD